MLLRYRLFDNAVTGPRPHSILKRNKGTKEFVHHLPRLFDKHATDFTQGQKTYSTTQCRLFWNSQRKSRFENDARKT